MPNLKHRIINLILIALISSHQITSFITRVDQPILLKSQPKHFTFCRTSYQFAVGGLDEDDELENTQNNFDGKGLVNYLGPYALAFLVSVAVTVGFVKFVLMDY